ncbi:MAG: LysM peptidoglycan-binding domain-containing protein [Anaerolineaceae bacterium]|nr:LysM peptidoglycan-binding domain-containing protein [Anaerolineaceae bacterium]
MKDQSQLKKTLFILLMGLLIADLFLFLLDGFFIWRVVGFLSPQVTETQANAATLTTPLQEIPPTKTIPPPSTETPEIQATETLAPTSTEESLIQDGKYKVSSGDTLQGIARQIGVTEEDIRKANQMVGDTILPKQHLIINQTTDSVRPEYIFSPLPDIEIYRLGYLADQSSKPDFTLHIIPQQYPEVAMQPLYTIAQNAVNQVVTFYHEYLETTFDLYISGTLLATNHNIRSMSNDTSPGMIYLLYDGTGSQEDMSTLAAFETARFYQDTLLGHTTNTLLKEGAAVYISMNTSPFETMHLPLRQFCKAYQEAQVLPDLIDPDLSFNHQNTDLRNFFTAGCFFDFLYTESNIDTIKLLYRTNDYTEQFGKSFEMLIEDFGDWLGEIPMEETTRPLKLVAIETDLTDLYQDFMPVFDGSEEHINIYREMDMARIAFLEGRFNDANKHLIIAKVEIGKNGVIYNENGGGGGAPDGQPTPTQFEINITITPDLPIPQPTTSETN